VRVGPSRMGVGSDAGAENCVYRDRRLRVHARSVRWQASLNRIVSGSPAIHQNTALRRQVARSAHRRACNRGPIVPMKCPNMFLFAQTASLRRITLAGRVSRLDRKQAGKVNLVNAAKCAQGARVAEARCRGDRRTGELPIAVLRARSKGPNPHEAGFQTKRGRLQ